MKYAIVIESAPGSNYSAYVPDLPGVAVTADTLAELHRLMEEAIALHLTALRADGDPIPEPRTHVEYVEAT